MISNAQQVGQSELKPLWKLCEDLVDTVQKLEEDGRPLIGVVRVTETLLEFVSE